MFSTLVQGRRSSAARTCRARHRANERCNLLGNVRLAVLLAVDIDDVIGRPVGVREMIETRPAPWVLSINRHMMWYCMSVVNRRNDKDDMID